jgi:hypothetical protein
VSRPALGSRILLHQAYEDTPDVCHRCGKARADWSSMEPCPAVTRPPFDAKAARARCEAATPGPWIASDDSEPLRIGSHGEHPPAYVPRMGRRYVLGMDAAGRPYQPFERDAAFIAHARTDLPAALDEIEALKALLDEAAAIVREFAPGHTVWLEATTTALQGAP